jgi:Flp pilus assembly protein TadG
MRQPLFIRLARDAGGATAVEYALVLPVAMMMMLGGIWVGMLIFSVSSMDRAVQSAARCMAVDANACGSTGATQTYAQSHYIGPAISPVFTASSSGCGHTVTATANFDVPAIVNVPLTISACYP